MTYKTLLFDIDDTLLDFKATEKQALASLFEHLKLPLSAENYAYYHDLNAHLWQQFERGQITKPDLLVRRFSGLFEHMGNTELDGREVEMQYRHYLSLGHQQMPNATKLLANLSQQHQLYVVTNGVAKTQERRLSEADFNRYFQQVFISEQIGAQKPEPAFFEHVAGAIEDFDKDKALVIGDSLSSDIKGANGFGLDSVWFNPTHKVNDGVAKPTYEIDQLLELESIVA
jgi:2-haloacid dehalogenase